MPINHDGHDHDVDQPAECTCGEVVRSPNEHTCLPIGWMQTTPLADGLAAWIDSWQQIGNPPEAYIPLTQEDTQP